MIACVAGGIVSAREIKFWTSKRRSREENGERDSEIPPARKLELFNVPHTSVQGKRIGREKYTCQSNVR